MSEAEIPEAKITLREYTDARFEAQEKAVAAALASQEKAVAAALAAADRAVLKAEMATEKRFENSNEWRSTVETLQRTYMPRTEFEQVMKSQADKLDLLAKRMDSREDRGKGMGEIWGYIVGAVGILALIISYLRSLHV